MKLLFWRKPRIRIVEESAPTPRFSICNDEGNVRFTCPWCNHRLEWDWTCHTYEKEAGRFYSCIPCDSAIQITCTHPMCYWGYTWGLNPRNPRSPRNEEFRPEWLVGREFSEWP